MREELRPLLRCIPAFSSFINLLILVPAMCTLQVFVRFRSNHSRETLLVLLARSSVALLILLPQDCARNRLQNKLDNIVDKRLSPQMVNAIAAKAAREPNSPTAVAIGSPLASILSGSAR